MTDTVDAVIVGGGIHGASIAQALAHAGHSVLVLERTAVAAGASGRSTRLIHGGLRYLEHGQPALVRESLRERHRLLCETPQLVRLLPMHIPIYRNGSRGACYVQAGLAAYALLGALRAENRFRRVPAQQFGDLDGLRPDGLRAVLRYFEAQTDDAALTGAVMQAAQRDGARLVCPAEFSAAEIAADCCRIRWHDSGGERDCRARVLINASGAWIPHTASCIVPAPKLPSFELVQGTHLLLEGTPVRGGYYLEAPQDDRPVFLLPWHDAALLGTTETPFYGDPGAVTPLPEERDYLLDVVGHYFPTRIPAVRDSYAGVRVLPGGNGPASGRSRETQLVCDDRSRPRLLTVLGGKLTTHRATARRALAMLSPTLCH